MIFLAAHNGTEEYRRIIFINIYALRLFCDIYTVFLISFCLFYWIFLTKFLHI